jgi:succinate dehydrogenase/fumarate reductase cytochrome b subunit (b558 family)
MTTTLVAPPIYRTSIGKKVIMATSGLMLVLYVIGHMIGNLKSFLSEQELNTYGDFLRRMGEPIFPHTVLLWIIRVIVGAALVLHVYFAIDLSVRSRKARQLGYAHADRVQSNPAPVTMRWGGIAIGLFVVFHLAHITWGWIHPGYKYVRGSVYQNVVGGFNQMVVGRHLPGRHVGAVSAPLPRDLEHVSNLRRQQPAMGSDHSPPGRHAGRRDLRRLQRRPDRRARRRHQLVNVCDSEAP